jgi:hypothetical protein
MARIIDGPASTNFAPIALSGGRLLSEVSAERVSPELAAALAKAACGDCVCWGIPFTVAEPVVVADLPVDLAFGAPVTAEWLVFLHTSDLRPVTEWGAGPWAPPSGEGRLGEHAADYVVRFGDGTEERLPIRRRFQLGAFKRRWGENCFEAVAQRRMHPLHAHHEQVRSDWGGSQTRVDSADFGDWVWWLWAWRNPRPGVPVTGLRLEPGEGAVLLAAVSAGQASSHPLRWQTRRKAVLGLDEPFEPGLDEAGLLRQIQLDLGQVISASPQLAYGDDTWESGYNNALPSRRAGGILVEYAAHDDARFHLANGAMIPVASLKDAGPAAAFPRLRPVAPATRRIALRVVEKGSRTPVPVKLHVHGASGEYLAPVDRHRIPNDAWFEDYSVDFLHAGLHRCTYIPGETRIDVPLGRVFLEVSRGFEIRPVRRVLEVRPDTHTVEVEIERVLPWRSRGWVTADTHVHFLSPVSALLEGSAEGVNVVNLLASQWGELMTNVGDFDGRTTWGSREAGGDGEHLVRVGTENRQQVLGHISLVGYSGGIIAPMTTGGPNESAIGDPIAVLLTEWARQCRKQGGLVIVPHFPNPRAEHAAAIVDGSVDAVEMTSWENLYDGISPYSLADWYRYLNCGYLVAAVGGTDKMSANTAVGTVRTYARIANGRAFDYAAWMDAVHRAETFVTYGPLVEFSVDGRPAGSRIAASARGATVDVSWEAASVTVPMTRVELVVNGEIRESVSVDHGRAAGSWKVKVPRSAWLALLVRGRYPDKPEIVAAHTSPVMVEVAGSPFEAAADAVTILEQIEGALAYLDTVGTRADTTAWKRMRLVLESAHRSLHNRMHLGGRYHEHAGPRDHPEHH